ncbi:gp41 [Clostera anachoreta granulovirus]|uniref:Gp41 n=1 Tax=Clostera anachoreta granulovirus TaxID=283675 RepID=F4ZKW6_9BBAC|nr:gp41 [Clostera anachoreta granulovirus]AEB00377.1 gp41 [Clostera anachoreta granulovirus]
MDKLSWNTVANMINLYRSNNTAELTPEQIDCMNTVRDIFIRADPVDVNVVKRFESDDDLIQYYANLEKKYGGTVKLNGSHGVFDKSFVISPIMKSYADKFYKRKLGLASSHLSEVLKYQMAHAITQNKPLPLFSSDATNDYLLQLHSKAEVAPNFRQKIELRENERLNVCVDTINAVVEDVLFGKHDGYHVNTTLTPHNRTAVHRFRHNITYLCGTPLTLSTNVFQLLEDRAVKNGQVEDTDYSQLERAAVSTSTTSQNVTQLAFENEALRRAKVQEFNIKYVDVMK